MVTGLSGIVADSICFFGLGLRLSGMLAGGSPGIPYLWSVGGSFLPARCDGGWICSSGVNRFFNSTFALSWLGFSKRVRSRQSCLCLASSTHQYSANHRLASFRFALISVSAVPVILPFFRSCTVPAPDRSFLLSYSTH